MADVTIYVDTDVSGGAGDGSSWANAFSSLNAAVAAEQADLTSTTENLLFSCRGVTNADTTPVDITGYTTSATYAITCEAESTERHEGKWSTSKYRIEAGASVAFDLGEKYITLRFLQIGITSTTSYQHGISGTEGFSANAHVVDSCIIRDSAGPRSNCRGIFTNSYGSGGTMTVINSIIYGWDKGIRGFDADCSVDVYNCTVYGCTTGIEQNNPTVNVYNTVNFNNTTDWSGTITCTTCAGDDTKTGVTTGYTWADEFTDHTSYDFSLKSGSSLIGAGTDSPNSGAGNYTDDIISETRSSTWDIGAFEYVSSGTTVSANLQTVAITQYSATVQTDCTYSADAQSLALTQYSPTVSVDYTHTADAQSLALTQHAVTVDVSGSVTVLPELQTLALTQYAPSISADCTVSANAQTVALTQYGVSITIGQTIEANHQTLALSQYAPTILADCTVSAGSQSLAITQYAPTISTGDEATGIVTVAFTAIKPSMTFTAVKPTITFT